jgi:hypothetical protein
METKGLRVVVARALHKQPRTVVARDGHEVLLQICFNKMKAMQWN